MSVTKNICLALAIYSFSATGNHHLSGGTPVNICCIIYIDKTFVSVVYENYVVVIQLTKKHDGTLKGEFKTAFVADNSIGKIRNSPKWNISMITR